MQVRDSLSGLLDFQMKKATVFSHEAHHGGLWTKLLENARKWTTIQPYFVADVVESCLPTAKFCKLCLPAAFLEKYKSKLSESIILEGPDSQKWPVLLGLSLESKPCLLQGWREFAADYKLVVQDHIVFFLCENSHFLVQVFDAHRNIKRRGDKLNSESVELANTQAPGGDEEENPKESMLLGRSSAPDPPSAMISSDTEEEEEKLLRLKRSRKLNRKSTESREGDELYTGSSERLDGLFKLAQNMKETAALNGSITEGKPQPETAPVTASPKPKLVTTVAQDKKPLQKRSPKLPTEVVAGKGVHNKKRQAKGMKSTPVVAQEEIPAPETQSKARNIAKVFRDSLGKEPVAEACPPLSPRPVEAAKPAFKRPKPRTPPAPSHKLMYISKRRPVSTQEREAALASAQEYARKSINNNFVMQLRTTQVYCGFHLAVPSGFAEALLLPPVRTKVTLFDLTGKTWEVEWMGDRPPRHGLDSAGWTRFALEHCLEEGDVCVFEIPDPKVFNISVEIFTVVPLLEVTEQGWRSHYIVPADDPKPQESQSQQPQASMVFPSSDKETVTSIMATGSLNQQESVIISYTSFPQKA